MHGPGSGPDHRTLSRSPLSAAAFDRSGSTLGTLPNSIIQLSRRFETAFRSPTAAACRQASAAGSTFPACFFNVASCVHARSVRFRIPLLAPDFTARGGSVPATRYLALSPTLPTAPVARSRPGPSDPSRSTRPTSRRREARLGSTPVTLHSPREEAFYRRQLADQRSGFVSSRLARCSVDLLEPQPSCTRNASESTESGTGAHVFPQLSFAAKSEASCGSVVEKLWIKRAREVLFER